jgi:coiled-coil domain-containing protein 61
MVVLMPRIRWYDCLHGVDIEELTRKTGNFKRFSIFVNMLLSALSHRSDAVFIDLLTTSDLVRLLRFSL